MPIHNDLSISFSEAHRLQSARSLEIMGPRLRVELHPPIAVTKLKQSAVVQPVVGDALIDTGAARTAVDEEALQKIGSQPVGVIKVYGPSGSGQQLLYPARLEFGSLNSCAGFTEVLGSQYLKEQGLMALIGRDLLSKAVLVYNGPFGFWTLCF